MRRLYGRLLPHGVHAGPGRLHERRLVRVSGSAAGLAGPARLPVAESASRRATQPASGPAPTAAALPVAPAPAFPKPSAASFPSAASAGSQESRFRQLSLGALAAASVGRAVNNDSGISVTGRHAIFANPCTFASQEGITGHLSPRCEWLAGTCIIVVGNAG